MVEKAKKPNKGSICEEDMSTLLERYSVKTVLTLLQEVEKVAGDKIDWDTIVKNTATGISSARECQMLWRHLAYGHTLTDQFDNAANPMDDDSDLEYEQEAFPAVSRETSLEAAACVKVLIASDYPIDSHIPNNSTIEAPLTVNVPKFNAFSAASDSSLLANATQGTNISIPVSVQKQPLSSGTCGEKRPNNGTSGVTFPPRRKRRGWSNEDDMKLTAAVQKYGERNWANIARGDFKNDRKASELSQRWATLRKKQSDSKVGTSSQHSEAQLAAAHRAITLALNTPMVGIKAQQQSQKASASPSNPQLGPKSHVPISRPSVNPTTIPDSKVKAAAVAAGARIATSTDASSLIEAAARSQNVVHIITGGSSAMKSSTTTSMTSQLPSNVHFIRNAQTKAPLSAQGNSIKSAEVAVQPNKMGGAPVLNVSSGLATATASSGVPKTAEVAVISSLATEMKELVQRDKDDTTDLADFSIETPAQQISEDQSAPLGNQSKEGVDKFQTSASGKMSGDNLCASKEVHGNPGPNGRHGDLPSTSLDGKGESTGIITAATSVDEENK